MRRVGIEPTLFRTTDLRLKPKRSAITTRPPSLVNVIKLHIDYNFFKLNIKL